MKLVRSKTALKGKPYYSWRIVLPAPFVEALGWKDQDELQARVADGRLEIERLHALHVVLKRKAKAGRRRSH